MTIKLHSITKSVTLELLHSWMFQIGIVFVYACGTCIWHYTLVNATEGHQLACVLMLDF